MMPKPIDHIFKWFSKINQKQWFVFSIITSTIGLWYQLILPFFGTYLKLVVISDGQRHLTGLGWFFTIITALWSFLSFTSQRYVEQLEKKTFSESASKDKLTSPLRSAYTTLCKLKLSSLLSVLKDEVNNTQHSDKSIPEEPSTQLKEISAQISNVLSNVLTVKNHNMKPEDFYVAIYYKFPHKSSSWKLASKHDVIKGLSTEELLQPTTSFNHLINDNHNKIFFYNRKQKAFENKLYLPDSDDNYDSKTKELLGSILCYKRTFKAENIDLIECVICVSTYDKLMLKDPNDTTEKNMKNYMENVLFYEFSLRIGIELCLDYLIELSKKTKKHIFR